MLTKIIIPSTYNHGPLPERMALCTPDTNAAILALAEDIRGQSGELRLSDLFRSYDMQQQAHLDWKTGKKKAYSPPPGGSMHEAGRGMDIDLQAIRMPLSKFWKLAAVRGFLPIIQVPDSRLSEAWHFDHRGSHQAVYDYVKSGRAGAAVTPYGQMAASSILSIGVQVDAMKDQSAAILQSGLIRLGFDPGPIDGILGDRTKRALDAANCDVSAPLKLRFPDE